MATLGSETPSIQKVSILGKESIHCGIHLVPYIARTVTQTLPSSTYVLVTDRIVAGYHLKQFEEQFVFALSAQANNGKATPRFLTYVIPPGETSKSREGKAAIEDFLLEEKCTRDTVLLALGGGVIGDLTGFVAATFMRGVRFCQIPTTLLAMVDSSVGGKTAIDTPHGKNLIGAFWQPEYIFIDPAFLETLPAREFSNGMAEVIKTAAIWNEEEFSALESRASEIFSAIYSPPPTSTPFSGRSLETRTPSQSLLLSLIVGSISVKSYIVTNDERETTGLRNLVNFGHTIGHAIEAVLTPELLHGEAVSVGMILEAEVSRSLGILGQVGVGRLTRCLKAFNLPVSLSDARISGLEKAKGLNVERLLALMGIDKKNDAGRAKKVVLLERIGKTWEMKATGVQDDVIRSVLVEGAIVVPRGPGEANAVKEVVMATPGSKSISNRALVLAALGSGTCRLKNLLHSDDTQVMMTALVELKGAKFSWEDGGETLVVQGGNGSLSLPENDKEIYLGNAGTAARFLTTVCALVQPDSSSVSKRTTVITGNARMKQRPVGPLVDALRANGVPISYQQSEGCLPLSIPPTGLKGGHIKLAASVSSQYVSSILLCAPYAQEQVVLELVGGQVISQAYIDMTIAMMREFGVEVTRTRDEKTGKDLDVYVIPKAIYKNPEVYAIESDASSATYPLAVAAITGTACTITNIGSGSLQGDAKFAIEVLKNMGCDVRQTPSETRVVGPKIGTLKALGVIDMEVMTDAFLTASVLAAVACGEPLPGRAVGEGEKDKRTTRILGIANQRVKECNRIRAMMDQLAKFGVETKELDDGLEIYGKPIAELKKGSSIHCYDDHRVAMAFSVLGSVVEGTVIEERRCVEKTWPNWWDDLQNKIGLKVKPIELKAHAVGSPSEKSTKQNGTAIQATDSGSVVLIGMRGSGKTFVGEIAARSLGYTFLDADTEFEIRHQVGVREFVYQHGWPAFRAAETAILNDLLQTKPEGYVISLGGGIVETSEAREVLVAYGKENKGAVVRVRREVEEIVKYLGEETARPAYGEPIEEVLKRREPWFDECATHEFINYTGALQQIDTDEVVDANANPSRIRGRSAESIRAEIARFFKHISGQAPNLAPNLVKGKRSYFLSLTYPDVTPALAHMDELSAGVDALELRVDLLRLPKDIAGGQKGPYVPPTSYVAEQLAALRQSTSLPIVFTVRTASQGGCHPDDKEKEAFELMEMALEMGVEYLDVEVSWDEKKIEGLVKKKGNSKIIASWHDWSGKMKWDGEEVKNKYGIAERLGDIVKIVGKANSVQDNFALRAFVEKMSARSGKPFIAINMGLEGQMSRILNTDFSPVTHPMMNSKAAPGQLSFAQIQTALNLLGLLPTKQFYLFGTPIGSSPSPTLHNTGFQALGLPHTYSLLETKEVDEAIKSAIKSPDFGGASVTIPHKLAIIPLLDDLTSHAKAIGAVNTVIPQTRSDGSRYLIGDNTDWIGIKNTVLRKLKVDAPEPKTGLVIGAGGTSRAAVYALKNLSVETIYLFNRTRSAAEEIVKAFPASYNIKIVDSLEGFPGPAPEIIVSTVPGAATTTSKASAGLYLSKALLTAESGVVVDMAYRPLVTPLTELASERLGWSIVRGIDVLLEQGFEQLVAWTGRRCPRELVTSRVWDKYNAQN